MSPLNYLSVCSGIEAATVAWHPLGFTPVAFSEIESFPSAVLAHHYADVPNLGDLTKYHDWPDSIRPRLIVGGTPCQAFSVAGLRKGLEDPRGNLTLVFLGLLAKYRPRWVVWENVPGVLSDKTGAFGAFLGGLGELGYGFAYRVLDAQFAGVPQRRRRVFVVGYLGDWRRAAAVLFEPESLRGDSPPCREKGEGITYDVAPCIGASGRGFARAGETRGQDPVVPEVPGCLQERDSKGVDSDTKPGHLIPIAFSCKDHGADAGDQSPTLRSMNHEGSHANGGGQVAVAFAENSRSEIRLEGGDGTRTGAMSTVGGKPGQGVPMVAEGYTIHGTDGTSKVASRTEVAGCLRTKPPGSVENSSTTVAISSMRVRRLTPRECERLQGFPDDYTLIPYRGKPPGKCPDGPRYKALGNSMAVPVMRWIGEGIAAVDGMDETGGIDSEN